MGKKLDSLLGRTLKLAKFKPTINLATSRIAVLKNQRHSRLSISRSDVLQLLNLGHHERALLRVEQVIKEQNMLDAFVMIEGYLDLLIERANLLEHAKICPDELKEAISCLLFASTRCGEFPELQEIRAIFTSRFGKEFAGRAIELRNNCGVNPKIIQKLSTKQPALESRLKVLQEIASENEIVLQIDGAYSAIPEDKSNVDIKQNQPETEVPIDIESYELLKENRQILPEDLKRVEDFTDSMKGRRKYKDAADAAQAAFESAAYAAAAARAAVELSRSGSFDPQDKQNSPSSGRSNQSILVSKTGYNDKIHPNQNSESDEDEIVNKHTTKLGRSMLYSSSDSGDYIMKEAALDSQVESQSKASGKEIAFDESDDDKTGNEPIWRPNSIRGKEFDSDKLHIEEDSKMEEGPRLNLAKKPLSVRTKRVFGR